MIDRDAGEEAAVRVREERFHDEWARRLDPRSILVDESWEAATCPEHRWIRAQIGALAGKDVLDFGCGAGEASVWLAKQGAKVVASDVSSAFLDLTERVAALHGAIVRTHKLTGDRIDLPPESFDLVYAGNVLHHVDTPLALDELRRVLRPGGVLVSWDPLRGNPLIGLYRRMARSVRTSDEHPLRLAEVRLFEERFEEVRTECFWLATQWLFVRFYLVERVHPSEDRYWKRIVREHERLTPLYRRLERADRFLLRRLPFLRRYCWNLAVCAVKPRG
jgi:SAM-dependent methyltransferase